MKTNDIVYPLNETNRKILQLIHLNHEDFTRRFSKVENIYSLLIDQLHMMGVFL